MRKKEFLEITHLNHRWIVCSFYVVSILPYEAENIGDCRAPRLITNGIFVALESEGGWLYFTIDGCLIHMLKLKLCLLVSPHV